MSKIVVLKGSVRKGGNSDLLANAFIDGAIKNNDVDVISVGEINVHGCIGCNACYGEKHICVQKDDMEEIYKRLAVADTIVVATPVYFYNISSQLKCVIDRLHNPVRNDFKVKNLVLLSVSADTIPTVFDSIKVMYNSVLSYFKLNDLGQILVSGVQNKGDIDGNEKLYEAFRLGESIK